MGGGGGSGATCSSSTCTQTDRQTGHVTTIPNTPAPRLDPSRAPSCPPLTPADPWPPSVTGALGCVDWTPGGGTGDGGKDPALVDQYAGPTRRVGEGGDGDRRAGGQLSRECAERA